MKALLQIQVVEEVSEMLNTREAATELMNAVREANSNHIEFDFSNVEFMSRSFADQFHKERIRLQDELKTFVEISNANEQVVNILRTVVSTQNMSKRDYKILPVFKFSNNDLLAEYLLSV